MLIQDPRKPGKPVLVLYDISDDRTRTKVSDAIAVIQLEQAQFDGAWKKVNP